MLISEFQFELPEELIAQKPLADREKSRMLCIDRKSGVWKDDYFYNFPDFLEKGDVIVLNNTKVFPARLFGVSETGARAEIFLVKKLDGNIWETLARPTKRLKIGKKIIFSERLTGNVLEKTESGRCVVQFDANGDFDEIIDKIGKTPLPPYIKRETDAIDQDRERYQTVFASNKGAIAAPTAGLHFTAELLQILKNKGVIIAEVTLHVGYGTFEPVRVENLVEHRVMPEHCEISAESVAIIEKAKAEKRRVIAIGTTTTRALESGITDDGKLLTGKRLADLTITPGYKFRIIDGVLTNFHLPQSSLLVLVAAFGGYDLIFEAYAHAVAAKYRFYSYGDCMFIS